MEQKLQGCLNLCEILESYTAQAEGAAPCPREVTLVFRPLLGKQELDRGLNAALIGTWVWHRAS